MLRRARILIVENEPAIARHLAAVITGLNGVVIGPVQSVTEALKTIATDTTIGGAVLDGSLGDGAITPVALKLVADAVPVVIYADAAIPTELAAIYPDLPVILKPSAPDKVVALLAACISATRGDHRASNLQNAQLPNPVAKALLNDMNLGRGQKALLEAYTSALGDELDAHKVIMAHLYHCIEITGLSRATLADSLKRLAQDRKVQNYIDAFADGVLAATAHESDQCTVRH